MPSKTEQVAKVLERETHKVPPGQQVSSVQALMDRLGVSIGTVIRGVDLATSRGVPLDRLRGPDGGYFRSSAPADNDGAPREQDSQSAPDSALVRAHCVLEQVELLIAILERQNS
jgi:DNA-binding transcriptional MocR family regulator